MGRTIVFSARGVVPVHSFWRQAQNLLCYPGVYPRLSCLFGYDCSEQRYLADDILHGGTALFRFEAELHSPHHPDCCYAVLCARYSQSTTLSRLYGWVFV